MTIKLGILGSTRGTVMQGLIDAITQEQLSAKIEIVLSDKADAFILKRAELHNIDNEFVDPTHMQRINYDNLLHAKLKLKQIDLVLLIGYMRILSSAFTEKWQGRIINVHPSLLPAFAGKRDTNIHDEVLKAKLTETGCTIHEVTAAVDQGPILLQKRCPVNPDDSIDSLKTRVQNLEKEALTEVVKLFTEKTP